MIAKTIAVVQNEKKINWKAHDNVNDAFTRTPSSLHQPLRREYMAIDSVPSDTIQRHYIMHLRNISILSLYNLKIIFLNNISFLN